MEKEFNFYLDEKRTIWYRNNFSIKAESEEQAKEIAIQMFKDNKIDYICYSIEQLHDTSQYLSVKDNDGWATEELYYDSGDTEMLIDNGENKL